MLCSFELVITWSSSLSLSLSSYSSWLLVPVCLVSSPMGDGAPGCILRLRRVFESFCTRRPVVTISSPIEDREDEEGCDDISTQDSSLRNRWGIPAERAICSAILELCPLSEISLFCRPSWSDCGGAMIGGGVVSKQMARFSQVDSKFVEKDSRVREMR